MDYSPLFNIYLLCIFIYFFFLFYLYFIKDEFFLIFDGCSFLFIYTFIISMPVFLSAVIGSILCTLLLCSLIAFAFYWLYIRKRGGQVDFEGTYSTVHMTESLITYLWFFAPSITIKSNVITWWQMRQSRAIKWPWLPAPKLCLYCSSPNFHGRRTRRVTNTTTPASILPWTTKPCHAVKLAGRNAIILSRTTQVHYSLVVILILFIVVTPLYTFETSAMHEE